jgi:hypothetical protein
VARTDDKPNMTVRVEPTDTPEQMGHQLALLCSGVLHQIFPDEWRLGLTALVHALNRLVREDTEE